MNSPSPFRHVSLREMGALLWVLCSLPDQSSAAGLYRQTGGLLASIGDSPCFVELTVADQSLAIDLSDGPLPIRTLANGSDEQPLGEVLVWIASGLLSALEFGWVTEDRPEEFPTPQQLRSS